MRGLTFATAIKIVEEQLKGAEAYRETAPAYAFRCGLSQALDELRKFQVEREVQAATKTKSRAGT